MAPTVGETKDTMSSTIGCLTILYDLSEAAVTVIEKDSLALALPLATLVTVSLPKVPAIVAFGEKGDIVNVKAAYWYITFCINKEFEPVDLFKLIVPSPNLTSLYTVCSVPCFANK